MDNQTGRAENLNNLFICNRKIQKRHTNNRIYYRNNDRDSNGKYKSGYSSNDNGKYFGINRNHRIDRNYRICRAG